VVREDDLAPRVQNKADVEVAVLAVGGRAFARAMMKAPYFLGDLAQVFGRTYLVLGRFIPVSTNSGMHFYIGNNPAVTGLFDWRLVPSLTWNDGATEVEAHRRGLQEGLSPSVAAMRFLWLIFYVLTLDFDAFGFGKLQSPARRIELVPLFIMVCFSLPYILTFTDSRYRLPMEAFAMFYAMIGLELCLSKAIKLDGPRLINTMTSGAS
jgi:hypothetical protein